LKITIVTNQKSNLISIECYLFHMVNIKYTDKNLKCLDEVTYCIKYNSFRNTICMVLCFYKKFIKLIIFNIIHTNFQIIISNPLT